ncbi:hypothetical protein PHYBOEH_005679 [Phytophthora boehmeriae]|uniref:Uncharacterized protein n=1 Tax=Phytophthora boehmeriae TaxID=109152 RepID=A0A8T1X8G6_9STRA|nr:hypothetical protein PHYBOEH_005679 [Phytophthora boehmeriae]
MSSNDEFNSLKCRYASKRCWNLRAIKRNGERHNLCEMHRQKANSNQRRLDKKRKAGQAVLGLSSLPHGYSDYERRMRMRASIAMRLEQELGAVPLTTQFIRPQRPTSLLELQRAAGILALGNSPGLPTSRGYSNEMDSRLPTAVWANSSYPRSPRAMLRVAAMAKMEPSMENRQWMQQHSQLSPPREETGAPSLVLPPIATAMARSGEGLVSSATLQNMWGADRRRSSLNI